MISFKIHTPEGVQKIACPSSWAELTLGQLVALETELQGKGDVLKLFSIVTGIAFEVTENLKADGIEEQVFTIISFLDKAPKWSEVQRPERIQVGSNAYKVPTKIGSLMLGQKILLLQTLDKAEDLVKNIPTVLATIMQPYIDKGRNKGKLAYSSERVLQIEKQLLKSPGVDCYGAAMFFFIKLRSTSGIGPSDLMTYPRAKTKSKRKLNRHWLRPSG